MTEYKYQKNIEELMMNPHYHMIFLDLTSKSTHYFKQGVIKNPEESKTKSRIEEMVKGIPELKDVNASEFSVELVNYLFEHRKK